MSAENSTTFNNTRTLSTAQIVVTISTPFIRMAYNQSESPTPLLQASTAVNSTYHDYGFPIVATMSVILVIAMFLAIFGNIMVILTIAWHKTMRTRTNMFIVNLAVADILVAIFDMPFSIITMMKGDWIFGQAMCEFNGYTMAMFMIASVHTLMYISVHKYISITRPFSRFMTPKRILVMIFITWFWSNAYALGGAAGWNSSVYKKGATQCGPSYPVGIVKYTHSLCNTLFNLLLPWTVMSFCYFNIFREIRRHMSRMRENTNMDVHNSIMQQKRISTTLFVVLICFLLCWSPYIGYSTYAAFVKNKDKVPLLANPLAYWCGYINSACNPIIYAFRSPSFRKGYYSVICGREGRHFNSADQQITESHEIESSSACRVGSFSQKSSQRQRKGSTLPGDATLGNSTNVPETTEKKRKPKRLVSMNSWASIILPSSPVRKGAPNGATFKRQVSRETEAGCVRPLIKTPTEATVSDTGVVIVTVARTTTPSTCGMLAENSLSVLSPIIENSLEDVVKGDSIEDKCSGGSGDLVDNDPNEKITKKPDDTDSDIVFLADVAV